MSEEKLIIGESILKPIIKSIDDALSSLEKQDDIEKSFRNLAETSNKIKNFSDFEDTPENRFVSFLGWSMISLAQMSFKVKSEKSEQLNKEENDKIKAALSDYLINIRQGFQDKSYQKVVESSKNIFNVLKV